jgi:general secretion pathway protein G
MVLVVPAFRGSEVPRFRNSGILAPGRKSSGANGTGGWTMVELLIVVSIIMILSALALTAYRNSVSLAKEAALRSDLFMMREAIDQYYADKGKYPESLQTLVSENYLRAIPKDPITDSAETWQTEEAEPQPGSNTAEPGIYEVRSGASGTALDGSRFADW